MNPTSVTIVNLHSLIDSNINHQINQKMNKLLLIYGCLFMSSSPIADEQKSTVPVFQESQEINRSLENSVTVLNVEADGTDAASFFTVSYEESAAYELDLNEIPFIEEETEVDLGFETADYLPEGFNPYENFFDLNSIIYIESETEIDLGFDTSEYLPERFDPYAVNFDVNSISFIEDEEVDLGFNTEDYLPEGFNPYEVYFNVATIEYVEFDEMVWEFGFDTKSYLPVDFDPFQESVALSSINYIEDEEIELGFDTSKYLPNNFDPYAGSN